MSRQPSPRRSLEVMSPLDAFNDGNSSFRCHVGSVSSNLVRTLSALPRPDTAKPTASDTNGAVQCLRWGYAEWRNPRPILPGNQQLSNSDEFGLIRMAMHSLQHLFLKCAVPRYGERSDHERRPGERVAIATHNTMVTEFPAQRSWAESYM